MAENKEKFCSDCKHDGMMASEYPCCECCNAYLSKFEPKTNFDRIKEMSVGEMAEFLAGFVTESLTNPKSVNIEKWLESEVQKNG